MTELPSKKDTGPVPRRELYAEIAAGDFGEKTLGDIENELKEIQNGKRSYNPYTAALSRGMFEGGRTLAEATLVCRADESAGSAHPRGSYEGENERGKRQQRLLESYAEATDCWYDLSNLDPDQLIGSGGESEVYRYDDDEVLKINTLRFTVSPQVLLERIAIHNTLFPASKMNVTGFGRNDFGEFCVIYTQPSTAISTPSDSRA